MQEQPNGSSSAGYPLLKKDTAKEPSFRKSLRKSVHAQNKIVSLRKEQTTNYFLNKFLRHMKRIILLALSLCCMLAASAQSSPEAKARVAEIRKIYAQAKKDMELPSTNKTVVTSNSRYEGVPRKETVTYYHKIQPVEDGPVESIFIPYLITNNFDIPGNKFYQEFLLDEEGTLVFYYEKNEGHETRLYFGTEEQGADDEGLVHEINTNGRTMDPPFACRLANELLHAFNLLLNREF